MIKVDVLGGSSIEYALQLLKEEARNQRCLCYCEFNGKELYSTDTIDEAYIKVTGSNKAEAERKKKEWLDEYRRREAEHKSQIPNLTEEYRKKARGLVLEERLEFWDEVVPIRLGDLYHGMELQQTLDICSIMRDDTITYEERLRKAYKCFMDAGHSGMSAHLTASMIVKVGEPLLSIEIEKEKEWIARSIALGFKKYNATPKEGSEIVYTVTEREDGILIVGYQETADLPLLAEKQLLEQ